ncbi:unnamed protein product [Candida verbasci]|uniref:Oxidant-induced cell-cycle arrest protein 5 n=1 Tax=Candida verbasci TaxID=1227364 RepID=A0A9W4TYD5_9ASCO|nr:unnamed protein product [Candida verbasci]
MQSRSSVKSNKSSGNMNLNANDQPSSSSQYVIKLNRTPSYLTPSQRLKLRKMNLNNSIAQFKFDETNINRNKMSYNNNNNNNNKKRGVIIDDKDEIIDDYVFNVPYSQELTSINQRDKFLFDNQSRTFSFSTNDSTRTNSIISHVSFNDSVSSIGFEDVSPITPNEHKFYKNLNHSNLTNQDFNKISKEAQELTVLFNKDEFSQIYEESFQKRKLLSNFKNLQLIKNNKVESNQHHTFTRPTWLPPKSVNEKSKHQQDADYILYNALYKENQLQQKRLIELNKNMKQRKHDISKWDSNLLKLTDKNQIDYDKLNEMIFTGVSPEIRNNVWWKINLLKHNKLFNESFCENYFDKFLIIQSKLKHLNYLNDNQENIEIIKHELNSIVLHFKLSSWVKIYNQVYKDLLNSYPDLNYFQDNQIMNKLIKTIISFIIYLQEQFPALNNEDDDCIFQYYFPGLIQIISIFYYNFKNTYKTFVSICQLYQYRLPNMILTYKLGPKETQSIIKDSLNSYIIYKFENLFKKHLNRLFVHFKIQNVSTYDYLPNLILSLGLNLFNFEISNHILDFILLSFNNDEIIVKIILNFIIKIQHKLYGSKNEILKNLLTINTNNDDSIFTYVNVGYEIEFINLLKNI